MTIEQAHRVATVALLGAVFGLGLPPAIADAQEAAPREVEESAAGEDAPDEAERPADDGAELETNAGRSANPAAVSARRPAVVAAPGSALLLLLITPDASPELAEAVRMEAASNGYQLAVQGPPAGETPLQRASAAQSMGTAAGARATVWLETSSEETGSAVSVRVLEAGRDEARHAPLAAPLATVPPRTFAAVVGSLLDEIEQPPQPTSLRIRVQIEVENEGETIDLVAEAEVGGAPRDGTVIAVTGEGQARPVDGSVSTQLQPHASPDAPQGALVPEAQQLGAGPALPPPALQDSEASPLGGEDGAASDDLAAEALQEEAPVATGVVLVEQEPFASDVDHPHVAFGFDVIPFIGTSSRTRGQAIRHYSLNLVGGLDYALRGVDMSVLFSYYHQDVHGLQVSGLLNYAGGAVHGAQLTSGLNLALGGVRGGQLGTVNVAADVRGAQVGAVNIARGDVRGVQFGLVNYAEDAKFAVGLVNIVRNGRTHMESLVQSDGSMTLTLKHGGRHFHYSYGLIARPGAEWTAGGGIGLGARITTRGRLFADIDGMTYVVQTRSNVPRSGANRGGPTFLATWRAMLGVRLTDWLALVAGAAFSLQRVRPDHREPGGGLFGTSEVGYQFRAWPSLLVGLQLL